MIERHGIREIADKAAAHFHVDAEFTGAPAQDRFHLRIAFEAFRHAVHFLRDTLRTSEVAVALQVLAVTLELLPAFDEPVGALEGIGTDFSFKLHRAHGGLAAPFGGLVDKLRLALERCAEIG